MRVDFTKAVHQVMREDDRSFFITGDLGYNALEGIAGEFQKRFLNAGVAEQNMIGVASGIAMSGYRVWVYSIAPFATYRCLEQIRNDACLHHLPVRIVGNGGGYTYGVLGSTHHALEDLAALKALPGMQLFFPCTNNHVASAVRKIQGLSGPSYLRLGISGAAANDEPMRENPETLTRQYREGKRATVIGIGQAMQVALRALAQSAFSDIDLFGIARYPFNWREDAAVRASAERTRRLVILDEHYASGGISESLRAELPHVDRLALLCAKYKDGQKYGSPAFHLKQSGMAPEDFARALQEVIS